MYGATAAERVRHAEVHLQLQTGSRPLNGLLSWCISSSTLLILGSYLRGEDGFALWSTMATLLDNIESERMWDV